MDAERGRLVSFPAGRGRDAAEGSGAGGLRPVDGLLVPAVHETVAALAPPPEDTGLVRLALTVAETIDGMGAARREALLAQTGPLLAKVLEILDERGRRRAETRTPGTGRLAALRSARISAEGP